MALVLLYHRISDLASDPQRLAVSPANFAQHLDVLREHCTPLSLSDAIERTRAATSRKGAVALTFDDGYADNLEHAKPALESHGVPATVFLTAAYVGGDREFWWDELERLLLTPGRLTNPLRLRIGKVTREWDLGDSSDTGADAAARHSDWNVERRDNPTARHRVYRDLCGILRTLPGSERDIALGDLLNAAGRVSGARTTHRVLGVEDVLRLTHNGVVDLGAHSVSHPVLSELSPAAQEDEIAGGKASIEALAGRPVCSFAYPFGTPSDYTRATVGLVRKAGFALACTATPGRVGRRSDALQLPRMLVRNWNADEFRVRLKQWMH
jgi:peptidoglycan/xylan/chitin deacetylase (PgdA/CDA1 family)